MTINDRITRYSATIHQYLQHTLCALLCMLLIACDGGISGTGDGGPVVVVKPNGPLGVAEVDSNLTTDPEGTASTLDYLRPEGLMGAAALHTNIPATFNVDNQNLRSALPSAYNPLRRQLTAFSDLVITSQVLLTVANQEIALACAPTACSESRFYQDFQYTSDIANYEYALRADLLPNYDSALRQNDLQTSINEKIGSTLSLSVVNPTISSHNLFDRNLSITTNNRTSIQVTWSLDQAHVQLAIERDDIQANLLIDNSTAVTRSVVRIIDHAKPSSLVAVFKTNDSGTYFEADLHNEAEELSQLFIRGFSNDQRGSLIARHPNADSTQPVLRETFNASGYTPVLQSCDPTISNCAIGEGFDPLYVPIDPSYYQTLAQHEVELRDFDSTLADNVSIEQLSPTVDELIITKGNATDPAKSAACSGQRISEGMRIYCWKTITDPQAARVFKEQLKPELPIEYTLQQ